MKIQKNILFTAALLIIAANMLTTTSHAIGLGRHMFQRFARPASRYSLYTMAAAGAVATTVHDSDQTSHPKTGVNSVSTKSLSLKERLSKVLGISRNSEVREVIEGDLFLIPQPAAYFKDITEAERGFFERSSMQCSQNEVMVRVWATSRDKQGERRPIAGLVCASNEGVPLCSKDEMDLYWKLSKKKSETTYTLKRKLEDTVGALHDEELAGYWRRGVFTHKIASEQGRSDNWSDHGHVKLGQDHFPTHFPYLLLKGKKDGDEVRFQINGKEIRLVINQEGSRYSKVARGYLGFTVMLETVYDNLTKDTKK